MNRELKDGLMFGLLVCLLIVLVVIFFQMRSDGIECVRDPFMYQTKAMSEQIDASISCQCTGLTQGSPTVRWDENEYITTRTDEPVYDTVNFTLSTP